MQKRRINANPTGQRDEPAWLPPDTIGEVEITSEESDHPIESALSGAGAGWRADAAGPQTIRVRFSPPRRVRRVRVVVEETARPRTQEFVLRAAESQSGPWREIARQQFNFSPGGATREQEDYQIDVPTVASLELVITPDISGGDARASLAQLRFG